jgi:hypothetical protein
VHACGYAMSELDKHRNPALELLFGKPSAGCLPMPLAC